MRTNKYIVLALVLFTLSSIIVLSQITQESTLNDKVTQSTNTKITDKIDLEEIQDCSITSYNDVQDIYSNCVYYYNSTNCLNTSGPNTACSIDQKQFNFTCKTGEVITAKNKSECKTNSFIVSVNNGLETNKKEIDFSSWGVCVQSTENNCLAITCGTLQGGSARNGIFNGCDSGKSCQKFLFCDDNTKILYKAASENFVEEDPTYKLSKLEYKEVGP